MITESDKESSQTLQPDRKKVKLTSAAISDRSDMNEASLIKDFVLLKKINTKFADTERSQKVEIRKTESEKVTAMIKKIMEHRRDWITPSELKEKEEELKKDWLVNFKVFTKGVQ